MRTFIAIDLPADLKQQLASRQQELRTALRPLNCERDLSWTTPDKMHLTLRFLGETTDLQRSQIIAELETALANQRVFHLQLSGLGAFPTWPRMRVLWTGIEGDRVHLDHLQTKVEQIAQNAGFPAEPKSFSPHITLARVGRNATNTSVRRIGEFIRTWSEQKKDLHTDAWQVDELIYMKSDLRPNGAVYTALAKLEMGR
jgi:2'-5' RNA ligase